MKYEMERKSGCHQPHGIAIHNVFGRNGKPGLSAFEIAVENGFEGTEAEWLETLKGADGAPGAQGETGPQGEAGAAGVSAYEAAVARGFEGTEDEWLTSLADPALAKMEEIKTDGLITDVSEADGVLTVTSSAPEKTKEIKLIKTIDGLAPDQHGDVEIPTVSNSEVLAIFKA